MVDARLAEGETDGWHYADLPEDGETFRASFALSTTDAQRAFGSPFAELDWRTRADLVQAVQDRSSKSAWHAMRADRVWSLWTRYACTAFYSHPWAWNEIGFGGPAYPRGYKNLGIDAREPWEVADRMDPSIGRESTRAEVRTSARQRREPAGAGTAERVR